MQQSTTLELSVHPHRTVDIRRSSSAEVCLCRQGLDALSFVGRATLEWGKAGVDAANQALTKLDVAGDTWLHGWDSPSPSAQIAARHASPPQPSPSHRDKPAECTENPAWSPFDFRDDSASESAASPAAVRESSPADATDCSSKSPGMSGCKAHQAVLLMPSPGKAGDQYMCI